MNPALFEGQGESRQAADLDWPICGSTSSALPLLDDWLQAAQEHWRPLDMSPSPANPATGGVQAGLIDSGLEAGEWDALFIAWLDY